MKLHHLHVAQREAGAQRHRQAVAALVARGRVVAIHGRPAAGGEQYRLCAHEDIFAGAHVDEEHARYCISGGRPDKLDGAMLFQPLDAPRPYLLGEPVDDLDAGQVALVHRAVERLSGEGLLVHGAVRIAVEEAAELVLELVDALDGERHELPGELLVRQPLAALDGVHEVALDRILFRERDVVAALHHARAAALAEQAFHRDRDRSVGRRLVRVKRGKETRAARTEDQDVAVAGGRNHCRPRTSTTSTKPMMSAMPAG